MNELPESYFADYDSFTEEAIAEITRNGILLKNGVFIDFSVCAENFKKANSQSSGKCVGEREITDRSFTFYANPKPIMIKFLPRNKLIELISPNDARRRFHSLQFKINDFGYTTYDLT